MATEWRTIQDVAMDWKSDGQSEAPKENWIVCSSGYCKHQDTHILLWSPRRDEILPKAYNVVHLASQVARSIARDFGKWATRHFESPTC